MRLCGSEDCYMHGLEEDRQVPFLLSSDRITQEPSSRTRGTCISAGGRKGAAQQALTMYTVRRRIDEWCAPRYTWTEPEETTKIAWETMLQLTVIESKRMLFECKEQRGGWERQLGIRSD